MNCSCSILSPFRWREQATPSCWAGDPEVKYSAKSGMTHAQIASESKREIEERTGRSLGEIGPLSARGQRGST